MTQLTTGAYVRKQALSDQPPLPLEELRGSVFEEQVWSLLETPQTVESLRRATSHAVGSDVQPDREHIERMLERLLDADLIELSPDS